MCQESGRCGGPVLIYFLLSVLHAYDLLNLQVLKLLKENKEMHFHILPFLDIKMED